MTPPGTMPGTPSGPPPPLAYAAIAGCMCFNCWHIRLALRMQQLEESNAALAARVQEVETSQLSLRRAVQELETPAPADLAEPVAAEEPAAAGEPPVAEEPARAEPLPGTPPLGAFARRVRRRLLQSSNACRRT